MLQRVRGAVAAVVMKRRGRSVAWKMMEGDCIYRASHVSRPFNLYIYKAGRKMRRNVCVLLR